MLKYDLHVHTAESSPCGKVTAKDAVRLYKDAGYSGICVTDHFCKAFFENQTGSAKERIDNFLGGYRAARRFGMEAGLTVLLGIEARLDGVSGNEGNEYLVYGLTEDFLYENPEIYQLNPLSFSRLIRKAGMMIYQAHPLRPRMVPVDRSLLDGIEGYNGNPRHNSRNDEISAWAEEQGIPMISGSDFHQVEDAARGGIITNERITSPDALLRTLRGKTYQLIRP